MSKRLADTAVVSFAFPMLVMEAFLCLFLQPYFGTGISLTVFIILTLIVLGIVSTLHRRITSGRLVLERGLWFSGIVCWVTGLVFLFLGPQGPSFFRELPQASILWIIWTSFWFVAGALAFQLEATIVKEAHRAREVEAPTESVNEPSAGAS